MPIPELNPEQREAVKAKLEKWADEPTKKGRRSARSQVRIMMFGQMTSSGVSKEQVQGAMQENLANTATLGNPPWSTTIEMTAAALLESGADLSHAASTMSVRLAKEYSSLVSFGLPTDKIERDMNNLNNIRTRRTPPEPPTESK